MERIGVAPPATSPHAQAGRLPSGLPSRENLGQLTWGAKHICRRRQRLLVRGWHSINWRKVWRNVRRLQARIVKAVQERRWGKVQALVYLLTHSYSGRAAAIVRVTTNQGAHTPGVDGETWHTPELKATAFDRL